jgi:hypothetical protein
MFDDVTRVFDEGVQNTRPFEVVRDVALRPMTSMEFEVTFPRFTT